MNRLSHDKKIIGGSIAVLAFLLAGCAISPPQLESELYDGVADSSGSVSSNSLSPERQRQIIDAIVGREVVFRVLWYEYSDLDPDPDFRNPTRLKTVTARFPTMNVKVPAGAYERRQLAIGARPGDVVKITGVHFLRDRLSLFTRNPARKVVVISVLMPRGSTIFGGKTGESGIRQTISDENLSAQWLEDVLAQSIVEFVAPALPPATVDLPKAKQGLVLKPPASADAVPKREPVVALLSADAEPKTVRRGDVVRLTMTFSVDARSARSVQVEESYLLTFNKIPLPKFPVRRTELREAGEHRGVYSQQIPTAAAPGTYSFKAEVCVKGTCSSRTTEFKITQ